MCKVDRRRRSRHNRNEHLFTIQTNLGFRIVAHFRVDKNKEKTFFSSRNTNCVIEKMFCILSFGQTKSLSQKCIFCYFETLASLYVRCQLSVGQGMCTVQGSSFIV
jgi:hypothetical protein